MGVNTHSSDVDSKLDNDLDLELEGDTDTDESDELETSEADHTEEIMAALADKNFLEEEYDNDLNDIENILELSDTQFPKFTLAKNKARFLRMVSWYRTKEDWIEVAPLSGVTKLFKQQTKELEGIRSSKLDYEMELEPDVSTAT